MNNPPRPSHHGCVLVIVGSVMFDPRLVPREDIEHANMLIFRAFREHQPRRFISGGAAGIDTMAERRARAELGADQVRIYRPGVRAFHGEGGYRERDRWMAFDAECLVRIYHAQSKTYGSGFTADLAEKNGAHVERYMVGVRDTQVISG